MRMACVTSLFPKWIRPSIDGFIKSPILMAAFRLFARMTAAASTPIRASPFRRRRGRPPSLCATRARLIKTGGSF